MEKVKLNYYRNLRPVSEEEVNEWYDPETTQRLYRSALSDGRDLVCWFRGADLYIATERTLEVR